MVDSNYILDTAAALVSGDRQETYGDAREMHQNIADLWTAYAGVDLTAVDVAAMMVLMKVARSKGPRKHTDNWIDICGYAALAGEMEDTD